MNWRFLKARQVRNSVSYSAYTVYICKYSDYWQIYGKKNYIFYVRTFFLFLHGENENTFLSLKLKSKNLCRHSIQLPPHHCLPTNTRNFFTTNIFSLKLSYSCAIYKCSFLTPCSHQLYSHKSQVLLL